MHTYTRLGTYTPDRIAFAYNLLEFAMVFAVFFLYPLFVCVFRIGGMDSNPMSGMGPDYPGMGQDAPPGFIGQQQQANDQQLVSQRPGSPSEFMGSQGK